MPQEPPKPPRTRQPSHSGDRPSIELDATVGAAKSYAASQDHVRPELARKGTLTGLQAARVPEARATLGGFPAPPHLPGELAPTLPVPNPLQRQTIRRPTPPSAAVLARRTPIPPPDDTHQPSEATSGPPSDPAELAAALAKLAEYERRERVQLESKGPGPYQQPLRSQSPIPSSAPSKTDAAIGKVVRTTATRLAERYGLMPLLLVFGIGGGVVAVAKPAAEPAKVTAIEARVTTLEQAQQLDAEQRNKAIQREAQRDAYLQCMLEEMSDGMAQLLPASDRVGNAAPMKPWVERCSRLKP